MLCQPMNDLRKRTQCEDALPARHGIGAHNRVHCMQLTAHVVGRSSRARIQGRTPLVGSFDESLSGELCGKSVKESLVGGRKAIINVIPTRPKRIAACFGELCQTQTRVVGGVFFELDIRMPLRRIVSTTRAKLALSVEFLALQ